MSEGRTEPPADAAPEVTSVRAAGWDDADSRARALAGLTAVSDQQWRPPWQSLPADLPQALAPVVPGLVDRIIRTVPDQIPAYAAARDGRYGERLRLGVHTAFEQLFRLPGTSRPALNAGSRMLMANLGAGEFREGRSMDALLGAYRMAAQIAFRELSAECARMEMDMAVVVDLGESIWAYIDELSSVSAQAYATEQSARAGVFELRRADLGSALIRGGLEEPEVLRLAALADWRVPPMLAVAVLPPGTGATVRERLGVDGLVVERDSDVVAVLGASSDRARRPRWKRLLEGLSAVVGPPVEWQQAPYSYRVARMLIDPAWGSKADADPVFVEEHLGGVVLGSEPQVVEHLSRRVLAPLAGLTPPKRIVLEETLLAWLSHWGARAPIAQDLGVHPQTVGYRVGRLRQLFGEALQDPDVRFELELVLRARRHRARRGARPPAGS